MNTNTVIVGGIVGALIIGGLVGHLVGGQGLYTYGPRSYGDSDRERGPGMMNGGMGGMMGDRSMHGDMVVKSEREFIEHMIPHHEEAITTANEVLARGATTPEIKALAEAIVAAQTKEVADMKSWYRTWYNTEYTPTGTYRPMMRPLTNLSGAELDKVFLEDMVHHHMGAIMMANSVAPHIEHDEMRDLAANIIRTQSDEIDTMRRLRAGLE